MKWILMILLLFGSVNALWVGNQWPLSVPDTSHLSALESASAVMQGEIDKAETVLQSLARTLRKNREEMAALATEIKSIESTYPKDKLPLGLYEDYAVKIARYNQLARSEEHTSELQSQ